MKKVKNILAALLAMTMTMPVSYAPVFAEEGNEQKQEETTAYKLSLTGDYADYVVVEAGEEQDIVQDGAELASGTTQFLIEDSFGMAIGASITVTMDNKEIGKYTLDDDGVSFTVDVSNDVTIDIGEPAEEEPATTAIITIDDKAKEANTSSAVNAIHVYDPESEDMDDFVSGTEVEIGSKVEIYVYNYVTPVHLVVEHKGQVIKDATYPIITSDADVEFITFTVEGDVKVTTEVAEIENQPLLHINDDTLGWVYIGWNDFHEGAALPEGETDFTIYRNDKDVNVTVKVGQQTVEQFTLDKSTGEKEITVNVTEDVYFVFEEIRKHSVSIENKVSEDAIFNVRYVMMTEEGPEPVDIKDKDELNEGESIFVQVLNPTDKKLKVTAAIGEEEVDSAIIDVQEGEEPGAGGLFGIELKGDLSIVLDYAPETGKYVLMNIPYDKFYEAEGDKDVDAVSSATLNKPRTGTLAGGSYHVNADGSDITGVIYPVYVEDESLLKDYKEIKDEDSVTITVTNRGQETTTEYKGKEALFEAPSYSYYVLNENPESFKVLNSTEEGISFTAVSKEAQKVDGVTGSLTAGARHADVEIKLTGTEGIAQGASVSGVILTDSEGKKYGLRHIANVWRATEIGWNLNELDLGGKKITNIRYITQDKVIDYPVEIEVPNSAYVLMNIPYDKFYAAEGDEDVDAVSSATLNKPRTGTLAGGSYHVNADGSDITGITYPVFVKDLSALKDYKQITDEDSITITVTNRGKETTTEYKGKEALFEAPSYAYYILSEKPAVYKTMNEDGSFTAVSARASSVPEATGEVKLNARHADVEISLTLPEGVKQGDKVSGIIVTTEDDQKYALRHVKNIWRATEIGWNQADNDIAGKKIKNIRYITTDKVIDYPVEIEVPVIKNTVTIDNRTTDENIMLNVRYIVMTAEGPVPTDIKSGDELVKGELIYVQVLNPTDQKLKVTAYVGDKEADSAVIDVQEGEEPGAGGLFGVALNGDMKIVLESAFLFDDVQDPEKSFYEPVYWAYENGITTGTSEEPPLFSPFATCTRAQFVTFLWRQQGKPEPTLTESPFEDVQNKELSYYKAVLWAVENKITTGTSETTFDPGKKVTRAQAVTFLWRANNKPAPKTTVNPFTDVAAGLSYSDAVLWAFENEITTGTSATTFNPGGDCTRGATVTFLWRTYGKQ
ncbi:MAG: S-layer homology domain-containing protein [Solobacterium sp.]|nr:S-layer homology domain-containing protein [Solobacterium sp.]